MKARGTKRQPEPASGTSEYLYIADAAKLIGASEKAIRARVARRQLPFRKLAGRVVFSRSELREFLAKLDGVTVAEALANAHRNGGPVSAVTR